MNPPSKGAVTGVSDPISTGLSFPYAGAPTHPVNSLPPAVPVHHTGRPLIQMIPGITKSAVEYTRMLLSPALTFSFVRVVTGALSGLSPIDEANGGCWLSTAPAL